MRLARLLGSMVLFLASCAVLTAVGLFVVGAYLSTWPVLKISPRNRRLQAMIAVAVAMVGLAREYQNLTVEDADSHE